MFHSFNNPEDTVESVYDMVKHSLEKGYVQPKHVEALGEMFTELAARKKEEAGGEQEG